MNFDKLKETEYFVEANDFETLCLWKENEQIHKLCWEINSRGFFHQVGTLEGLPVNLVIFWNTINDKLIGFYNCCSRVCDWEMIKNWLQEHNPKFKDNHCDSMNFSHCLHFVRK